MKKVVKLSNINTNMRFKFGKGVILLYRWIIFSSIIIFCFIRHQNFSSYIFHFSIAVVTAYNIIITLKSIRAGQNSKKDSYLILVADSFFVSVFTSLSGGVNSEIYIIYFFMTGYCAFWNTKLMTMIIAFFNLILFSAASIISSRITGTSLDYSLLLLKDIYIFLCAYGINFISKEIRQIYEIHKREYIAAARTDSLTGLANRHYFEQKLKEETDNVDLTSGSLNVLMFDIDNFKQFNDSYGHLFGDELLVMFSDIIKQNIRKKDIAFRYGGEEFLILLRDLEINIAASVAERIRKQLEKQRIQVIVDGRETIVTASCGIAQYPAHSGNIYKIIEYADKALYFAKNTGKNKVVTFDQIGIEFTTN